MTHLRKSSLNILNWRSTSMTKTFTRRRIFELKIVNIIPLITEKNLAGVETSVTPIPMLYRNQVETL
jgi:hypothetical protein